jgi:deoxyribonuclease V
MIAVTKILNLEALENEFKEIQEKLLAGINLTNKFQMLKINLISGIDLTYWQHEGKDYAVCCIVTLDYKTHEVIESKYLSGEITVPYIPGYLTFRELPLILENYKLLENKPDIAIFDGNGYLHYRHMGIATHASFHLEIPTIGVAKNYLKIENVDYTMPKNEAGEFSDIVIHDEIYGRVLRTHKNVKPIFISCGNWIDLDTTTQVVLSLINQESRLPIPVRMADIETRKQRAKLISSMKQGKGAIPPC